MLEIYKAVHGNSGNSLKELYVRRKSTLKLRSKSEFMTTSVNSVLKVKKTLKFEQPSAIKQRLLEKTHVSVRDN